MRRRCSVIYGQQREAAAQETAISPVIAGQADSQSGATALSGYQSEFTWKKGAFEIAIVTVGVLLALIVDEARQSSADRALAAQAKSAMRAEIEENRVRLASKLVLLHQAYRTLQLDAAAGPALVGRPSNFQIAMTDAAWTMAVQTGTLRHISNSRNVSRLLTSTPPKTFTTDCLRRK